MRQSPFAEEPCTRVVRIKTKPMCQERRIQPITARAGWITISYKQALIGGKQ